MKLRIIAMEIISKIIRSIRMKSHQLQGYANIDKSVILESRLVLDKVYPQGIHIGENSLIASGTTILCHEHVKRDPIDPRNPWVTDTYIGKNCFIGVGSMILPGVRIGDEVIVGAATVVTKDVPSNSIVVGNPGRILDRKISMNSHAVLSEFDQN
ncbi:MAG: acyltransferase [Sulfuricurvum sp.]|uniref:acyltransferase n=1 Tax=Sulfuricurvum sp. TaxID=2025608 RepID=UPI0025DBA919|nr:acyltransferase [Sulfuricurvum sp.]MCK9372284.1 acyltransferase [Sulfuricurvum sp.]